LENKHSEESLENAENDGKNNAENENPVEKSKHLDTRNQIIRNLTPFLQNITLKSILEELEEIECPYHNFKGHIKSIIQNKLGEIIDKRIESFTSLDLPLHSKLQESLKIYQSPVPISNCLNTVHPGIPYFQLFNTLRPKGTFLTFHDIFPKKPVFSTKKAFIWIIQRRLLEDPFRCSIDTQLAPFFFEIRVFFARLGTTPHARW